MIKTVHCSRLFETRMPNSESRQINWKTFCVSYVKTRTSYLSSVCCDLFFWMLHGSTIPANHFPFFHKIGLEFLPGHQMPRALQPTPSTNGRIFSRCFELHVCMPWSSSYDLFFAVDNVCRYTSFLLVIRILLLLLLIIIISIIINLLFNSIRPDIATCFAVGSTRTRGGLTATASSLAPLVP